MASVDQRAEVPRKSGAPAGPDPTRTLPIVRFHQRTSELRLDASAVNRAIVRDVISRVSVLLVGYSLLASGIGPNALGGLLVALASVSLVGSVFHECIHGNLQLPRRDQRWIAIACGAPLGLSVSWWEIKHVQMHHRHAGDPARDPDIQYSSMGRAKAHQPWRPLYRLEPLVFVAVLPLATLNMLRFADIRRTRQAEPAIPAWRLVVEKYLPFLLFWSPLAVILGPGAFFRAFLVTELLAGVIAGVVVQLQHNTELSNRQGYESLRPGQDLQFYVTSDTASRYGIWRWISGGTNIHVAHHLYPSITYVELADATKTLRRSNPDLPWPEHSSVRQGLQSLAKMLIVLSRPDGRNNDQL